METEKDRAIEPEEIEVTPEMIAAGESVLLGELGGAVTTAFWNPPDLAVKVYRAMIALDCENKY